MIPKSGNRFSEKIMRSQNEPDMSIKAFGFLLVAGALVAGALVVGSVAPASAEFFGCNEPRIKVSYSSRPAAYRTHDARAHSARAQFARAYVAPRQRHASYSSQSGRRVASQWR
jgi:hypothetical protein